MNILNLRNQFICARNKLGQCGFIQELLNQYSIDSTNINVKTTRTVKLPKTGPGLKQFLIAGKNSLVAQINPINPQDTVPYLNEIDYNGQGRNVFFEVYGCQMNINDTEIVWSILKSNGYEKANTADNADVVLLMTCAIREKAESKVNPIVLLLSSKNHNCQSFNRFGLASSS